MSRVATEIPQPKRARRLVQIGGFLRKEIVAVARQPRLLLVLVAGPFIILLLFGIGYDQQQSVLRTAFVGPADSIYERSLDQFTDDIEQYVINDGYTTDAVAAQERLADGEIDAVVIFPADPLETVLAGEQAEITVLHDKIDPIQQVAVEVSSQVAVQELNARVLEEILGQAQESMAPLGDTLAEADGLIDELAGSIDSGDAAETERIVDELSGSTDSIDAIIRSTVEVTSTLDGDAAAQDQLAELEASAQDFDTAVNELAASSNTITEDDAAALRESFGQIDSMAETVATIDPGVVVRPFVSDTASLQREPVDVNDYFAPAAVALLLQHMALTFAAMSLVTDRELGLFEVFRVGPIDAGRVMIGKYLAFTLVGAAVGASLVAAIVYGLGVPMRGDVAWLAAGLVGLLTASVGLGLVLSLLAKSSVQAVQFAMLALLAGLFFGGFFLDLEAFSYPVKLISWMLPVSYGIRLLRDVMLRGLEPSIFDLIGLATTTVVFGVLAWVMLHRRLRTQ